ncbi:MAG TPA: hypothetical protein VMT23_02455 [Candidatus Binatia bacterium]|nr:hypothetical protein [Candidatus Binatia bacterium]
MGKQTKSEEAAPAAVAEPPAPEVAPEPEPSEPEASPITVTLVMLGTGDELYEMPDDATVGDLLVAAGLSAKEGQALVNSEHADLESVLPAGATVVFATKIKGGRR